MKPQVLIVAITLVAGACAENNTKPSSSKNKASAEAPTAPKTAETSKVAPAPPDVVFSELTEQAKPPTEEESKRLRASADRLIASIASARTALAAKSTKKASHHLAQARKALTEIKTNRPSVEVTYQIWDTLGNTSERKAKSDFAVDVVPILSKLKEVPKFVVDPDSVNRITQDDQAPLELLDAAVFYSEIDLPLAATEFDIAAAEGFLGDKNISAADRVLADIELILSPEVVAIESPIVRARDEALAARVEFAAGHLKRAQEYYDEAREDLTEAALDDELPAAVQASIKGLNRELDQVGGGLELGSTPHKLKLKSLVHNLAALARYEGARIVTASKTSAEMQALNSALLEIELSRVSTDDEKSHRARITSVRQYLEVAAKNADTATKARVDLARNDATKLEVTEDEAERRVLHSRLQRTLRDLVYHLTPTY